MMDAHRLSLLEKDVLAHAQSLSAITVHVSDVKQAVDRLLIDKAVQDEADKNLRERLERIETSIRDQTKEFNSKLASIYKLAWWFCTVFGGAIIIAFVNFLLKGGLNNLP